MKIYWHNGKKNVIGENVRRLRNKMKLTQKELTTRVQLKGVDMERLTIGRIENGERFVTDYEVRAIKEALETTFEELYK